MGRDLGLLGESHFKAWCAAAGIVANESKVDKTGWDFYLELNGERIPGHPDFLHQSATECKVQVKATDMNNRKVQVELSNLRSMATTHLPSFYVLLEFDGKDTPVNAFVKFVDDKLIEKILGKVHAAENHKPPKKLNQSKMTVVFDEAERLDKADGALLLERLNSCVGNYSGYLEKKSEFLKKVGFDDYSSRVSFSIESEDEFDKLLNYSLGLEGDLNVSNVIASQVRFGINTPIPAFQSASAVIQILAREPESTGFVIFRESKSSPAITFEGKLYRSLLSQFLSGKENKSRVETEYFNLFMTEVPGLLTFSMKENISEIIPLVDLKKLYRLFQVLRMPGKRFMELVFFGRKFLLTIDGACDYEDYERQIRLVNAINYIVGEFDYDDSLFVNQRKISASYKDIFRMAAILRGDVQGSFKFSSALEIDLLGEVDYFFVCDLVFENVRFAAYVIITGRCEKHTEESYSMKISKTSVERKLVFLEEEFNFSSSYAAVRDFLKARSDRLVIVEETLQSFLDAV